MKRIKILCVVLLIFFFGSLYQIAILPFVEGVKYGLTIAKYQFDHKEKTDDFLLLDVISKNYNYLEDTEINIKTGEKVLIRPTMMTVIVHSLPNKPIWWLTLQIFYSVLILAALLLGVWVPFLVVKIVRSLQNSEVFDRNNLKRINRIGIILLLIAVVGSLIKGINIYSAKIMVDLLHYNFSYANVIDFNPFIMGVVILIMNEILRISIEIKEEQDMTI